MSHRLAADQRLPDDAYYTPAWAVQAILPRLNQSALRHGRVLEPACGAGAILREVSFCRDVAQPMVQAMDIRDMSAEYEVRAVDFQHRSFIGYVPISPPDIIITNPPYSLAMEFVEHALRIVAPGGQVAMLLRLGFLASQKRADFHRAHPSSLYVLPRRPSFTENGKTDSSDYAWFVWGPERRGFVEVLEVDHTIVLPPPAPPIDRSSWPAAGSHGSRPEVD